MKENNKKDFSEKYLKSKMPKKHTLVLGKDLDLKSWKSIEKERVGERKNKTEVKEKEFIIPGTKQTYKHEIKRNIANVKKEKEKKIKESIIMIIIKKVESIITFSKNNNVFLIFFTNEFWKEILKLHSDPNQNNIFVCSKLLNAFILYYNLV